MFRQLMKRKSWVSSPCVFLFSFKRACGVSDPQNLRPKFSPSFVAVFVGYSVTSMSTLAHNKRSCSKKWKISCQNCVFPMFFRRKIGTILSRRSRLSRTSRAPSRLSRPRPIDCDAGPKRTVKIFPVFGHSFFEHRQK